ncbi:MAG: YihY/virulence factor BrkB family protein [Bacteroidia bacterium]|nr:YihY/virulence factor BrkB family protein [Bacteroidia bacterium]
MFILHIFPIDITTKRTEMIPKIINSWHKHALVKKTVVGLKNFQPPGFGGVGLFYVIKLFWKDVRDPAFVLRANAMAYNFFFALIPSLIFIFTLVPYIPIPNFRETVHQWLSTYLPQEGISLINGIISTSFEKRGWGVISISFLLLLYSSTRSIITMMACFNKRYFYRRNVFQERLLAVGIFFVLFLLLIIGAAALIFGEFGISYLGKQHIIGGKVPYFLLHLLNWLINLLLLFGVLSFIYWAVPSVDKKFHKTGPGSFLAGLLMMLATIGFRFFISNFGNYNKVYGSLTAVIILLVWFYWVSIVLLIGFELNASIERAARKGTNLTELLEVGSKN